MAKMPKSAEKSELGGEVVDGLAIHRSAEHMPSLPAGPFARLNSGRILSIAGNPAQAYISNDEGATWNERPLCPAGSNISAPPTGALLCTDTGTAIVAFSNLKEKNWTWSDELKDAPGARLPTCAMRSTDEGETWQDVQKLHDDWTGATRDIIQTRGGAVVFASMKMRHHPGRHTVLTYRSEDDGVTWAPSNVIDLGGNGHHDGATEGTLVELKDGRLLQYIRTNWGQFWRAESADGGRTWHPFGPSGIEASSAPGILERLASGRIVLLWNRPYPEGEADYPLRGGDGVWSATPARNFREELSMSFSEDECETWSPPVVVARKKGECSYPYVFEAEPGILWITAHRWDAKLRLREADFVR
ncbi:MAG: exo-alpha-sialidase [Planctomycetes bacterium]|nr:exo-alpha-sialidase [Planctomycetota bacterium]